jgi:hypothetical protein
MRFFGVNCNFLFLHTMIAVIEVIDLIEVIGAITPGHEKSPGVIVVYLFFNSTDKFFILGPWLNLTPL